DGRPLLPPHRLHGDERPRAPPDDDPLPVRDRVRRPPGPARDQGARGRTRGRPLTAPLLASTLHRPSQEVLMIQRHFIATGLAVAGTAALLAGCTGTARTAGKGESQYASPSPDGGGGDVVDKARADAEKAGEKIKEGAEDVKRDAKPIVKDVE